MSDHYDRLENRSPSARETALFRDLKHVLTVSRPRVPALRFQLKGFDLPNLQTRADLATIPVFRRADLLALQAENAPLGGCCSTRLNNLRQAYVGPGPLVSIEGQAKDWWGMARALFAAGLRKGTIVLNCFSYDLEPHGHVVDSGAAAIGCPVIPGGNATIARKVDAIVRLRPNFFCGTPDQLKQILDYGIDHHIDLSCLDAGLVMGSMTPGLRNEFSLRGLSIRSAFAMPELGVIAFESGATDGLTLNEGLILEVVEPGTDRAVADGTVGELVITRINADFPLLRYGTGAFSALLPQKATCGRTNVRIRTPQERVPDSADLGGMRIHAAHIQEIASRHPSLGRIRLFMRRPREKDELHLKVEHGGDEAKLTEELTETLHRVTSVRGTVEIVAPGSLSDDEAMIIDERPLN